MRTAALLIGSALCLQMIPLSYAQNRPPAPLPKLPLYERIHTMIKDENALESKRSEKVVEAFVTKIYPRKNLPLLEEADIDKALKLQQSEVCRVEDSKKSSIDQGSCVGFLGDIKTLVRRNARLRQFVRDLQISAASFETGMTNYTGQRTDILTKLPSIAYMWQSDTDRSQSSFVEGKVRGAQYPDLEGNTIQFPPIEISGEEPDIKVDKEVLVASVWRYRNGLWDQAEAAARKAAEEAGDDPPEPLDRTEEPPCDDETSNRGDGTELQHLETRFCTVEAGLFAIYELIQDGVVYDPPLKPGEIAIFTTLEINNVDDGRGNAMEVSFWATNEDVGLMWDVHLDPVLPSLNCSGGRSFAQPEGICDDDGAILGGRYPPQLDDPKEGTGFCAHPFAKRGYLCRPTEATNCIVADGSTVTPADIHLYGCNTPNFKDDKRWGRWTESGPNICGEGGWRAQTQGYIVEDPAVGDEPVNPDTPSRDNEGETALRPDRCSRCYVDTVCERCNDRDSITKSKERDGDGRIEICIDPNENAMSTYLYIREMVHAQQLCKSPPIANSIIEETIKGTSDSEGCCAYEYQASLAQCNAMAEDGLLSKVEILDANNVVVETIQEIDIPTCAGMLTNFHCGAVGTFDESCADFPTAFDQQKVWEAVETNAGEKAEILGIAQSCSVAVTQMDARVQKQKNSLPQVCSPLCETKYVNTIGNNACMLGQCLEESFERHRLIPGRMSLSVQDEAFPWDADAANDPNYGAFMMTAPQLSLPLPPYRPALLAREMDNFLCQLNGLPTQTPPILCSFDPLRRLQLPTKSFLPFAQSLVDQPNEHDSIRELIENVAPAIGTRIGMDVYKQYLGPALAVFEELILSASDLLKNMEEVNFPGRMCRRNANDDS